MKILGIESSCDETAASVIEVSEDKNHIQLLSLITATSLHLHAQTGGIIPEIAARNQIKDIIPVIFAALEKANALGDKRIPVIDAIAVTYGPGLIGSLLVGVETAKTLSSIWAKPLLPINHLFGHLYANFLETSEQPHKKILFPAIGLILSGAHTDLILMKSHKDITWLGGTRDDAAGEAFDKIGRMVGLPYPAGPTIEKLAQKGNPKTYHFPRPLMYDKAFDFSFSGLKTAVLRVVEKQKTLDEQTIADICRATQDAITDVIVYKTILAAEKYNVKSILLGGGVAANQTITESMKKNITDKQLDVQLYVPHLSLCTDNAAMIAAAAVFQGKETPWENVIANPELYFD